MIEPMRTSLLLRDTGIREPNAPAFMSTSVRNDEHGEQLHTPSPDDCFFGATATT